MEKEFVPHEQALELKQLGFNDECFAGYDIDTKELYIGYENNQRTFNIEYYILAPTFSQVFRWFREKYRLDSKPEYFLNDWYCFIINDMKGTETSRRLFTEYPSYEEAELECLKKLIEIVKSNKIWKN